MPSPRPVAEVPDPPWNRCESRGARWPSANRSQHYQTGFTQRFVPVKAVAGHGAHGSARHFDADVGRGGRIVLSGDHGDSQTFRLRSSGKGELVRAEGLEPSRALRPNGFSYPSTAFVAPAISPQGLGSGLSLHRVPDRFRLSGAARLVSTPSPPESGLLRQGLARDRHVAGFPEFEQFCIAGFPASTQVFSLKSGAYAISPRPHGFKGSTKHRLNGSDF